MGNEVAGIDIVARLDQFRAEMAKIPGIGEAEAKALVGKMSKEIKGAEAAARKAASAGKEAGNAFDMMGNKAGRAGSSAGKLAGVLSMISPEAADAARSLADLGDVGEVGAEAGAALGVSLTAAGVAVAALSAAAVIGYGVWNYYATIADLAADKQERLNAVMLAGERASIKLSDLGRDLAVLTGDMTSEEAKYERSVNAAKEALDEKAKAIAKETGLSESQMQAALAAAAYSTEAANSQSEAQKKAVALMAVANAEYQGSVILLGNIRDAELAAKQTAEDKEGADRAATEALRAKTEATQDDVASLMEAAAAETGRARIVTDAVTTLMEASDASGGARLEGEAAVNAQLDETIRLYGEIAGAALLASRSETERAAIVAARNRAIVEAERAAAARVAEIRAQAMNDAMASVGMLEDMYWAAVEKVVGYGTDALGSMESISSSATSIFSRNADKLQSYLEAQGDSLTASEKRDLEERIAQQEKAALASFYVGQGAAAAEAIVNTALSVSKSLASAPYPYNLIPAGLALAAGVAQEVAIASAPAPSFGDTPGVMQMEQGGNVHLAAGDLFAAAQTQRDLERQVSPDGGAPQTIQITMAYKHRAYDRFMVDNLRADGPLSRAFRTATGRVGHSR